MDNFLYLVICGISNYADLYKNDSQQSYTAATAATYIKELLYTILVQAVANTTKIVDTLSSSPYLNPYVALIEVTELPVEVL